jgi:hypothetical protein
MSIVHQRVTRIESRRLARIESRVATSLLVLATACQLAVDVGAYEFDDAGVQTADLEPLPAPGALEGGSPPDADVSAPPPQPAEPADAGSQTTPTVPPEQMTEPPPLDPPPLDPEPLDPEPPEPLDPEPPEPEPPPPDPENGCSLIEYCYAYQVQDTTDEERCIQLGCSLEAASQECRTEIADVCGTAPLPPFVMITLAGERVILD